MPAQVHRGGGSPPRQTQALSIPDLPLLTQPDSYPQSTDNRGREPAFGGCGQTLEGWQLVPPMSDHIPPQNQGLGFPVPRLKERVLRNPRGALNILINGKPHSLMLKVSPT